MFADSGNPDVSVKISGSDSLYVTMYCRRVRCESCLQARDTDRLVITIRQRKRERERARDRVFLELTLEPRSLKIISTSKILPNCCREREIERNRETEGEDIGQGRERRTGDEEKSRRENN